MATTYTYTVMDANGAYPQPDVHDYGGGESDADFGVVTINNRTYQQNAVIEPAVLPAASGGDGTLTYALSPALPSGLSFDAATRTLSGTPTATAEGDHRPTRIRPRTPTATTPA